MDTGIAFGDGVSPLSPRAAPAPILPLFPYAGGAYGQKGVTAAAAPVLDSSGECVHCKLWTHSVRDPGANRLFGRIAALLENGCLAGHPKETYKDFIWEVHLSCGIKCPCHYVVCRLCYTSNTSARSDVHHLYVVKGEQTSTFRRHLTEFHHLHHIPNDFDEVGAGPGAAGARETVAVVELATGHGARDVVATGTPKDRQLHRDSEETRFVHAAVTAFLLKNCMSLRLTLEVWSASLSL